MSKADFIKWLRYYHHFCEKYRVSMSNSERLRLYLEKLREKNQNAERCRQARRAVALYLEMQGQAEHDGEDNHHSPSPAPPALPWRASP